MVFRNVLIIVSISSSFLFIETKAFSQTAKKYAATTGKSPVTKKRKKKRRSYKKGNFGALATYGMWYVDTNMGGQGFYNWTHNLQFFGGVATTKSDQKWKSSSDRLTNKITVDLETISGGFRYFLTDSLYLSGSLNHLYFTGSYDVHMEGATTAKHEYDSIQYLGSLAIGNQWIFRNGITVGADWIGAGKSVSQKSNLKFKEGEPDLVSESDLEDALNEQTDYHGPVVQLGYMF